VRPINARRGFRLRRGVAVLAILIGVLGIVVGGVFDVVWKRERGRLGALAETVAAGAPDGAARISRWVDERVPDRPADSRGWLGPTPERIAGAGGDAAGKARLAAVMVSATGRPARVGRVRSCPQCPSRTAMVAAGPGGWTAPGAPQSAILSSRPLILDSPHLLISQAGSLGGALCFCVGLLLMPGRRGG